MMTGPDYRGHRLILSSFFV